MSHILAMAAPGAVGRLTQIGYQIIDLYFVTRLGVAAIAGVNAAGNAGLILLTLAQVMAAGTVVLISQSVGARMRDEANLLFNQAFLLSATCGVAVAAALAVVGHPFLHLLAADVATVDAGVSFIMWSLPGYACTFPMTVLSSALRGLGIVRPTIVFHVLTLALNAVLAPILIGGWGTGLSLGVKGAGLATSCSVIAGTIMLFVYFHRSQGYIRTDWRRWTHYVARWRNILRVGAPVGAEFVLMLMTSTVVYYAIRTFGASAQAGFGIGLRVMQAVLLPGMSVAFAVGPIIGQNFGARICERMRETFFKAALMGTVAMIAAAVFVHGWSEALVGLFVADSAASEIAATFLKLVSWTFVAQGLVYICSSAFQGMGNTVPSMISASAYFIVFSISVLLLSSRQGFSIDQVWYLSIAAVSLQSILSLWLLQREFRRRVREIKNSESLCGNRTDASIGAQ